MERRFIASASVIQDTHSCFAASLSLRSMLREKARQTPGAIAIMSPGRAPLTYGRLLQQVETVIAELRAAGVRRQDRVAVVLPNGPEMAVAFLAVAACSACAPLNPAYRASEFDFYLSDLNARALLVYEGLNSPAADVARERGLAIIELSAVTGDSAGVFNLSGSDSSGQINPDCSRYEDIEIDCSQPEDVALVLHTSGTTSRPKIVPLTHANICASARNIQATLALKPEDRCLNVMPLFHIHGLVGGLLSSLTAGASIVCAPGFYAPQFFQWLADTDPTWFTAVPTMHQAILARAASNDDIIRRSRLKFIRSSSSALPPSVMLEMERAFRVPVIEAYGMTEAAHQMSSNPLPPLQRKPGSIGIPSGPEIAIMDEAGNLREAGERGEIVIRGANVMLGYESNPTANATAFVKGWFRTGDQGYLDKDGYLFITGRIKEIINRGGEKISPGEVDQVIIKHPQVAQVVTFAVPDERLGEEVAAAITLIDGGTANEREIRRFAAEQLADFKVPRRIIILDELPKGPTGKLQRIGLAQRLGLTNLTASSDQPAVGYTAPRTEKEKSLTLIWSAVLGLEKIGIHDDFFQLGGDSLLASLIISRVREALGAQLSFIQFFETPTIAAIAKTLESSVGAAQDSSLAPLLPVERHADMRLSSSQQRLWLIDQMEPGSYLYNVSKAISLKGSLNIKALRQSITAIIERHEILRTRFASVDGNPTQIIAKQSGADIKIVDLCHYQANDKTALLNRLAVEEARKTFCLSEGPLLRTILFKLSDYEHALVLTFHHIVSDGWSMDIFLREMAAFYRAFHSGISSQLPQLSIQYADYAHWQRESLQGEEFERQLSYWMQRLSGQLPALQLSATRRTSQPQTLQGGSARMKFSKALTDALKQFSRQEGVTLYMVLLAALKVLLYRHTGQEDVIVGSPIAGRNRIETEKLIGFFVNTLVLRTEVAGHLSFSLLLDRVRKVALEAYANQDVPFEKLVECLQPERESSRMPLIQVMFQLRTGRGEGVELPGLKLDEMELEVGAAKFDLNLDMTDQPDGLSCLCEYSAELFDATAVLRMMRHFQSLLEAAMDDPARPISKLSMLSPEESQQLLVEWNDTASDYASDASIAELFEEQVEQRADAVAISSGSRQISYAELNRRANRLAYRLRSLGVGPEHTVGILMRRSAEMIVAVLGVLKAGAAYVPVEESYPARRREEIFEDAGVSVVVRDEEREEEISEEVAGKKRKEVKVEKDAIETVAEWERNPPSVAKGDNLAYVMHTSGTTGAAKGIAVTHRGVARLVKAVDYVELGRDEVILQYAPIGFDASTFEIWGSLLNGGRLVIAPPRRLLLEELGEIIKQNQITTLWLTAGLFHLMADERLEDLTSVRQLLAGGDVVSAEHARKVFKRAKVKRLINGYGPTENTTFTCCHSMSEETELSASVPIGRPINNTQVYVLDLNLEPAPVGVPGELHIGGDGLARHYLNQAELVAEKFIPNPFSERPGARLYKTGDAVQYLDDGAIEFQGRIDRQVKIRGFRIEPREVEVLLKRCAGVRDAIVEVREVAAKIESHAQKDKRLIAYILSEPETMLSRDHLRDYLQERLPHYMIPHAFVMLDRFPLTPNGKVDRESLPLPDKTSDDFNETFAAPRTPVEEKVVEIWRHVLGREQIGIHDNFFHLGGHSLMGTQIVSRLRDALEVNLSLDIMFKFPTPAATAVAIAQLQANKVEQDKLALLLNELNSLSEDEARQLLLSETK